jgi:hypothetical protein
MLQFRNLFWLSPSLRGHFAPQQNGNHALLGAVLAICLANGLTHDNAIAALPASSSWLTGAPLQAKLDSPVSLRFSGQPLRDSLEHLAEAYRVAIFLDRRIDPGQSVEIQVANVSLQQGLEALAAQQRMGISQVGGVIYFGPAEAARDIATLAALARDEVERVPTARKSILRKTEPLAWKELTTPRELIERTAQAAGLKLVGLDHVPHDLWPHGSWPPMTVTDRLTLLAIGFDLQVRVSKLGDAVALVPRVAPAKIVKSYPAGAQPEEISRRLAEYLPAAEFKVSAGKLFVRAHWEDHLQVQAALKGKPLKRTVVVKEGEDAAESAGIRVYTLSVQNKPLRPVLETLARQMDLTLQMDDLALKNASIDPDRLISFQVKGAQRDALWQAALSPLGLSFKITGDTIAVAPAAM